MPLISPVESMRCRLRMVERFCEREMLTRRRHHPYNPREYARLARQELADEILILINEGRPRGKYPRITTPFIRE